MREFSGGEEVELHHLAERRFVATGERAVVLTPALLTRMSRGGAIFGRRLGECAAVGGVGEIAGEEDRVDPRRLPAASCWRRRGVPTRAGRPASRRRRGGRTRARVPVNAT